MTKTLTLLAALLLGSAVHAHQITVGDLEIVHPSIPAPFAGAKSAAGYMAIVNNGTETDRLIAVSAGFADMAMLHLSQTNADGVATMSHIEALEIPPGETVMLEPGGYHVMFMGLKQTLAEGDALPAALTFEKAGTVEVDFMVDPPGDAAHNHEQHGAAPTEGAEPAGHDMAHATGHALGHGQHGPMSLAGMTDPEAITVLLKAQFETPDSPLAVDPVTVQGDVAVAGWSQDGRGGRAFLRRDADGWFVELCAGRELASPEMLQTLGLSAPEAETLAGAAAAAEAAAGPDLTARLDLFEGTVVIGRGEAHPHGG